MTKAKDIKKITDTIYSAIDIVNEEYLTDQKLKKSKTTKLMGEDAILDSLGLVTLIVEVENKIEENFSETVVLADDRAMSRKNSPFKNVQSLATYISETLEQNE
tara:strand:- start:153 stop:464 length:312 start_codon:yes stop_codon:yes gene_type:complete